MLYFSIMALVTSFYVWCWLTWPLSHTLCPCRVRWIVSVAVGNSLLWAPLCWKQLFAHWDLASDVRKVAAWYRCEQACPSEFQGQSELEMCCSAITKSQRWSLHLGRKKAEKSADLMLHHLIPQTWTLCSWKSSLMILILFSRRVGYVV